MHLAQGGLVGRGHGTGDLRRHQRHLEHRTRGGTRTPLEQQRYAPLAARIGQPHPSLAPSARTHDAAAARALPTARTPGIARVAMHTPPQQQPQPQDSTTRNHAALRAACATHARAAPPPEAAPPNSRHHALPTTHDDEKMPRAHTGTKPETPVDGTRKHWAFAPATGRLPCSSHASVAAWLTQPHGRRHKPPPQPPCALLVTTTN